MAFGDNGNVKTLFEKSDTCCRAHHVILQPLLVSSLQLRLGL